MKDANRAMRELRLDAQKHGYVVYDIHVRRAGFGVAYLRKGADINPSLRNPVVFAYHPTLMKALVNERNAWKDERQRQNRGISSLLKTPAGRQKLAKAMV